MKNLLLILAGTMLLSCNTGQKDKDSENKLSTHVENEAKQKEAQQLEDKASESTCSYDNLTSTLGKGLIIVKSNSVDKPTPIEVFNDSLLRDKYVSWNYYEEEKPEKPVCPKYFHPDYDIVHFVYLKETSKSYQILNGFNEIKYLPKVKANKVQSWKAYILSAYGIGKSSNEKGETVAEQPFREAPSENAPIIEFPEDTDILCPMEIKGDWVNVQYDCSKSREDNKLEGETCHQYISKCKPAQTAWIKWREKNKVLIDILLIP